MSKRKKKENYLKMLDPSLLQKLAQARQQEFLYEAERQRMLSQVPRRYPQLMRNVARRFAAFIMSFPFSGRKLEQPARTATGPL
jgi:hypothetical protein